MKKAAKKAFILFFYTAVALLVGAMPDVRSSDEYEDALCNRIAFLMRIPDSWAMVGPADRNQYFVERRDSALDAAETLLQTLALPLDSRVKVQECMKTRNYPVELTNSISILGLIEDFIYEAKEADDALKKLGSEEPKTNPLVSK